MSERLIRLRKNFVIIIVFVIVILLELFWAKRQKSNYDISPKPKPKEVVVEKEVEKPVELPVEEVKPEEEIVIELLDMTDPEAVRVDFVKNLRAGDVSTALEKSFLDEDAVKLLETADQSSLDKIATWIEESEFENEYRVYSRVHVDQWLDERKIEFRMEKKENGEWGISKL